jgi:hypothetical protein
MLDLDLEPVGHQRGQRGHHRIGSLADGRRRVPDDRDDTP